MVSSKAIDFEKRVERVFRSIEADATIVEWNASLRDPDTAKPRQIDVLLQREDGSIVHVECRNRRTPQSVQWIEELEGRRVSLGATAVIGVSSSGFSQNAIRKAQRFGITLFKLSALSEENLDFALNPPDLYLRAVRSAKFRFLVNPSQFSYDELDAALKGGFQIPFVELQDRLQRAAVCNSAVRSLSKVDPIRGCWSLVLKLDGRDVDFIVEMVAEAVWSKMKIKPYSFRKLKPGQVSIAAEVADGSLHGVEAELVIGKKKILFQIDFSVGDEIWTETTYANQIVIAGEQAVGKKLMMRQKGVPQFQCQFSIGVNDKTAGTPANCGS